MAQEVIEAKLEIQKDPVIEEMMAAGLHFGHKTSKTHPKMKPFIGGVKNTVHIIDLEKTKEKLAEALEALVKLKQEGKNILFVGTKIQIKSQVMETAKVLGLPYICERWIGGTLTNFEGISKRIQRLLEIEKMKESGDIAKYTKKEQAKLEEERKGLEVKFGGIRNLMKLPDAVFVCDLDENELAVKEAKKKKILTFAVCDTNCDPSLLDFLIPANDDAASSIAYILLKLKEKITTANGNN
ncbi:MAG: small subunit ribosomal protein S2 [Parcubacteria group bacterium Greene0714_21]|nr:MAG: small subunit ribosomal protein S2 [Parcubacteria group bacterium Greene0416_39]TSC97955.1 MAG: small subunit ribosomal protein S2 [Parcubacteria group bacterium Greene1014_47]TSD04528.1 MAG: small subunit ribosomal protein S2 [Parcubacteria group bacterium Greene0714_21]